MKNQPVKKSKRLLKMESAACLAWLHIDEILVKLRQQTGARVIKIDIGDSVYTEWKTNKKTPTKRVTAITVQRGLKGKIFNTLHR